MMSGRMKALGEKERGIYRGCLEKISAWPGCRTGQGGRCYSAGREGSCCCCLCRTPKAAAGCSSAP